MTRDDETRDLKGYLRRYADSALAKSRDGAFCCPLCGSGTGEHKTGALGLYDGDSKWKCQSCGAGGDIYDLIGAVEGIADFMARKDRARELYGAGFVSFTKREEAAAVRQAKADAERDTETDFTPFFEEATSHLEDAACLAYLSRRGISIETARFYGLGFCAEWRHPKAPCAVPTSPRLIIPTSPYSYLARDVRDDLTDAQARFAKSKAGKTRIFGFDDVYIFASKSAFIVEGEIDAMSVHEAGGEAIALGSASNINLFFTELADRRFSYPLILSLDNDEAGRKAEEELAEGLQKRGLPFIRFCVSGGLKDANEALCSDRTAFFALVREGERQASEMMRREDALRKGNDDMKDIESEVKANSDEKTDAERKAKELAKKQALLNMSVAARARGFSERTRKLKDERCISTGFAGLDDALRGGLYPGLYILGGGTSIGKTAFMLQMADAIASAECESAQELEEQEKTRRGVLYFSLETSADELMARSVSRLSRQKNIDAAIEYRDILDGFRTAAGKGAVYDDLMAIFQDCLIEHEGYGAFMFIHESVASVTLDRILEYIGEFEKHTGLNPVVFIDYLQMIPNNDIVSDKRAVDASVTALKRAARDYNVPIIAASSINRAHYGENIGMASYKESGGIEYTADVLLGLQWKDCGDVSGCKKQSEVDAVHEQAERRNRQSASSQVLLTLLKNRRGAAYREVELTFEKPYGYFAESGGARNIGARARAFYPTPSQ